MKHWTAQYVLSVLEQLDWSMNKLAEEIDVAATTVNRPIRSDEGLSPKTISKIYRRTGIDPAPFTPKEMDEPISVYKLGASGQRPETNADRVLKDLDSDTTLTPKEKNIVIRIDGARAQVSATVDKDGLRDLINKLEAVEKIIDS